MASTQTPHRSRLKVGHGTVSVTVLGMVGVLAMGPAMSAQTNPPIPIQGRAPTATGKLKVMFPNGTTAVTNNAVVGAAMKPADFLVSTSGLTLQDADGDTGLRSAMEPAAVTWVWKYNNAVLTPAQLAAPFSTSFLGKTLTATANATVTVSSSTGAPTTGTVSLSSDNYTLVVPVSLPVVQVNGATFAMSSGFPQTGFRGAQFQIWMDGSSPSGNSNYEFTLPQPAPWVSVDSVSGVVRFAAEPSSAEVVTIQITDKRGGPATEYKFKVQKWFVHSGADQTTVPAEADNYCATKGGGYTTVSYEDVTNAVYHKAGTRSVDGKLWDEWGNLKSTDYAAAGWEGYYMWAREKRAEDGFRYFVYLDVGYLTTSTTSYPRSMVCSKPL